MISEDSFRDVSRRHSTFRSYFHRIDVHHAEHLDPIDLLLYVRIPILSYCNFDDHFSRNKYRHHLLYALQRGLQMVVEELLLIGCFGTLFDGPFVVLFDNQLGNDSF